MPNIERGEIDEKRGEWRQHNASNPGRCYCGNYWFYSSLATCNHCVQTYPYVCGQTVTAANHTVFCGKSTPTIHVATHKINVLCCQCQGREGAQGQGA